MIILSLKRRFDLGKTAIRSLNHRTHASRLWCKFHTGTVKL